jgi:hypothetical protein
LTPERLSPDILADALTVPERVPNPWDIGHPGRGDGHGERLIECLLSGEADI